MDNHPIPQDVTGFQFKLVGDMTVKQFAYLAGGAILGWIFFSIPLPIFVRLPLALLCLGSGASFAFLPVEGRPLDLMITHFIQALFSPNQYLYQKVGGTIAVLAPTHRVLPTNQPRVASADKLQQYLQSIPHKARNEMDQKENSYMKSVGSLLNSAPTPEPEPIPTPYTLPPTPLVPIAPPPPVAPTQEEPDANPIPPPTSVLPFRGIPSNAPADTSLPSAPQFPNIIVGLVKDSRGNVLPGMMIEVRDTAGNPVRAFKSSPRGQFAISTTLQNGTYTLVVEDPGAKNTFKEVPIIADGQLIPPITVTSTDQREELRKHLFGG